MTVIVSSFNMCTICLNLVQSEYVALACGHIYHVICLYNWKINYNNKCPDCRTDIHKRDIRAVLRM